MIEEALRIPPCCTKHYTESGQLVIRSVLRWTPSEEVSTYFGVLRVDRPTIDTSTGILQILVYLSNESILLLKSNHWHNSFGQTWINEIWPFACGKCLVIVEWHTQYCQSAFFCRFKSSKQATKTTTVFVFHRKLFMHFEFAIWFGRHAHRLSPMFHRKLLTAILSHVTSYISYGYVNSIKLPQGPMFRLSWRLGSWVFTFIALKRVFILYEW